MHEDEQNQIQKCEKFEEKYQQLKLYKTIFFRNVTEGTKLIEEFHRCRFEIVYKLFNDLSYLQMEAKKLMGEAID